MLPPFLAVTVMSWFLNVLVNVKKALYAGWERVVRGFVSLKRPQKPHRSPATLPVSAVAVKEEAVNSNVYIRQPSPPQPVGEINAHPISNNSPPLEQRPCRTQKVRRGSQTARALFHDAFNVADPNRVAEKPSTALFPNQSDGGSANELTTSPTTDSSGGGSPLTPDFEGNTSSPTTAGSSTAPTTPEVYSPSVNRGTFISTILANLEHDGNFEDDIPLSALMIRGIRDNAKRHGFSGIIADKLNESSWISNLKPATVSISSTTVIEPAEDEESLDVADMVGHAEITPGTLPGIPPVQEQETETVIWPSASPSPNMQWNKDGSTSEAEEISLYSVDSFIPSQRASSHLFRRSFPPPEITLTPPSQPASPVMLSSPSDSMMPFENSFAGDTTLIGSPRSPHVVIDMESIEDIFKPDLLLVPTIDYMGGHTKTLGHFFAPVSCSGDDITRKKRKRNGYRLETSSIDLILAGLDQTFPDTPTLFPHLEMLGQPDMDSVTLHRLSGVTEVESCFYEEKEKLVDGEVDERNLGPEVGVVQSILPEDLTMTSRFSDSSEDECDDTTEVFSFKPGMNSQAAFADPLPRRSSSRPPSFDPCSVLSTILEEEENEDSAQFRMCDIYAVTQVQLQPSAFIDEVGSSARKRLSFTGLKRRWFSLIEASDVHLWKGEKVLGKAKRLSAPALIHTGSSRPCPTITSGGGMRLSFTSGKTFSPLTHNPELVGQPGFVIRPKSLVPLADAAITAPSLLPFPRKEVGTAGLVPWTLYNPQGQSTIEWESTFSRRSSVSSGSMYSFAEDTTITAVNPGVPVPELSGTESGSIGCFRSCGEGLAEQSLVLNMIVSHPQGLDGILAILDTLEIDPPPERPLSSISVASTTFRLNPRWSMGDDGYYADSEGDFSAAVAV
ncbi:hypothetical protein FA15DRAFT_133391 [Coprinopsis marcescibilis]|uniref:Uncharacterized protein n=1 Tax=Coprinopsis marcescibilis TaxID=230819 RepID=A0A5C3L536_COPMA|nr:hypothetical protein FA15DRAFT_133391 [Coprinopsis marcescibilis]